MTGPEEEVRPAVDGPALPTVAEPTDIARERRRAAYRARQQVADERGFDSWIRDKYGPEWVGRSKS